MMRNRLLGLFVVATFCASCGGSGGYGGNSSPAPPTNPSPVGNSNVTTITISGNRADQSFSPNPAMCTTGQTVVWKNADNTTHRIVIPELGIDTGNIAPGASSAPVSLANVSKTYHCSLHPSMVGGLNDASPAPNGGNCGPYGC
jgi:plastocyanin